MSNSKKINEPERLRQLKIEAQMADEARKAQEAAVAAARWKRWEDHRANLEGLLAQQVAEKIVDHLEASAKRMESTATVKPQELATQVGKNLRFDVVAKDPSLAKLFDEWLAGFANSGRFLNLLSRRLRKRYSLTQFVFNRHELLATRKETTEEMVFFW